MYKINENNGSSTISLICIIALLIFIATFSIVKFLNWAEKSKAESYTTNMITIKAKTKGILEKVSSSLWDASSDEKDKSRPEILESEEYQLEKTDIEEEMLNQINEEIKESDYECYILKHETLNKIGLSYIDSESYVLVFDKEDLSKVDIIYKDGIKYKDKIIYSLSKIQGELGE